MKEKKENGEDVDIKKIADPSAADGKPDILAIA